MLYSPGDPATFGPRIDALLADFGNSAHQLLPALHAVQDALGYIPPGTVATIAAYFNLTRADVHGVITFYHHFRSTPPARHMLHLCRAEACQSMGGDALLAHAQRQLGCQLGGHSADGQYAIEPVYCLGQCATAPALMLGETLHARVTIERFDTIIAPTREAA